MPRAEKKVTDSQIFCSDIAGANCLFAAIVRSKIGGGRLLGVDFAEDATEEERRRCRIIRAEDIPGENSLGIPGVRLLCQGEIRYAGEPVAILVSDDEELSRRMVDGGKVEARVRLPDSAPKNSENQEPGERRILAKTIRKSENYDPRSAGNARFSVTGEWKCSIAPFRARETNRAFVQPFPNGKFLVHAPNQWLSSMEEAISKSCRIPKGSILIDRTLVSARGTNAIVLNEQAAAEAVLCAKITGRPVSLSYSRDEQEEFVERAAEISVRHTTSLDEDGRIVSMDVRIDADVGLSCAFSEEIADRLAVSATGALRPLQFRVSAKVYSSSGAPRTVDLSSIAMHTFHALQRQLSRIHGRTGISPVKIMRMNLDRKSATLGAVGFEELLDRASAPLRKSVRQEDPGATRDDVFRAKERLQEGFEPSEFDRKLCAYFMEGKSKRLSEKIAPYVQNPRGIAISMAAEGNGYSKRNQALRTQMRPDGKFVIDSLAISPPNWGIWTRTVNEILKIDRNMVFLSPTIEQLKRNGWPDTLCENVGIRTHLLKKCCLKTLGGQGDVECRLFDEGDGRPEFFSAAGGVCTLEIEIDPCTMSVEITRAFVAIDCGRVFNVQAAKRTVRTEFQKILGTLVRGRRVGLRSLEVEFVESAKDPRQIGSLLLSLVPGAFASALSVALGREIGSLPVTGEELYNAGEIHP